MMVDLVGIITNESGGKGEVLPASGLKPGTECKLTRSAINNRWKIPEEIRVTIPALMVGIAEKSEVDRDRIAAAKVLVAMEGQNQEDQHIDEKNERLDTGKPTESVQFKAFVGIDPERV